MGGLDKLLLPVAGAPLLAHVTRTALATGLPVTVVLPPYRPLRQAALAGFPVHILTLEAAGRMGASLAAGVATLPNAASVIGTPAFSWAAAATATKYQFEYDNDSDFSSPIYTSIDITTTSHTPPAIALGAYSWHVRGKDAGVSAKGSQVLVTNLQQAKLIQIRIIEAPATP